MKFLVLFANIVVHLGVIVLGLSQLITASQSNFTDHTSAIVFVGGLALVALFVMNASLLVGISDRRIHHALGCLLVPLTGTLVWSFLGQVQPRQHQWFLASGIREYRTYAYRVERNRSALSSNARNIAGFLTPAPYNKTEIMAETNADGTLFIMFLGRGNDPRAGYFYYTGKDATLVPGSSDLYHLRDSTMTVRRLTNFWYENQN